MMRIPCRLLLLLSIVLPSLLLSIGCGQKGPLYLPGNPSEARTSVPAGATPSQPAADTSEDDDQDE